MSAEKLPEKLNKLEIAPSAPQAKLSDYNLPIVLNPFYTEPIISGVPQMEQHDLQQNYGKCRLRRRSARRRSESVLDEFKAPQLRVDSLCAESLSGTRSVSRVHRQPFKKIFFGSVSRKFFLRESVLRSPQTCSRTQRSARWKLLVPSVVKTKLSIGAGMVQTCDLLSLSPSSAGMTDFRDLVTECQTLLGVNVDGNTKYTNNFNCISDSLKMFTTIQASVPKFNFLQCTSSDSGDDINNSNMLSNSIMPITPTLAVECTNVSSRTSTSSTSSTCSHQAGTGVSNAGCDDVTIDELASYFDTLVHIPKKMSSMAEMMYI